LSNRIDNLLIGHSPAIEGIRRLILELADTPASILIVGETGTGKELVARCLHAGGSSRTGNFVALNCGGVPESLFESEIFGHEPGAFTGASKRRIGKIEHAHKGTLFLDEIDSMPCVFSKSRRSSAWDRTHQSLWTAALWQPRKTILAS
jgi:DNA-binding NtrC family response regulator